MLVNDTTTRAEQMVAAVPAATRNVRGNHEYLAGEAFLAILNVFQLIGVEAPVIPRQKNSREAIPSPGTRDNAL
ncbi:hypothetical protein FY528_05490 [Hymenobacter lutimineralis]|uniref:Serine/threonine specific protein phosphatases domain-containing protein n=1 Tax=Hymenobacter lutimineralis TaxID=2606448 RepID=A0A5D6VC06_9BACT|nr:MULTISPECIES: hypothetical protein [Hymenobacter]QIX61810.1 hypothetical protein HER32_11720 [Hymenobacter sp. BT18]TYZ12742.1 hypothetical protein FY528_05490 [Hymenobacter lutimineralis]